VGCVSRNPEAHGDGFDDGLAPGEEGMQDCPVCRRSNEKDAGFCRFCGSPLSGPVGLLPPPPAPLPPPPQFTAAPPAFSSPITESAGGTPARTRHRRRFLASTLVIVGVCLTLVALTTPWWFLSINQGSNNWTGYVFPGTAASSCTGDCGNLYWTCSYVSGCSDAAHSSGHWWDAEFTNIHNFYEGILAALLLGLLAGLFTVFAGLRGSYRATLSPQRALLPLLGCGLALLLVLIAVCAAVFGQPGAVGSDFSGWVVWSLWFCAPGASPTSSFWGSNSGSCAGGTDNTYSVNYSWGPSVGWVAALLAVIVLLVAALLLLLDWVSLRRNTRGVGPTPSLGIPPPPGTPAPPPDLVAPPPQAWGPPAPPPGIASSFPAPCPVCGTFNAVGSATCGGCRRPLG
jgi:hypothetical protein